MKRLVLAALLLLGCASALRAQSPYVRVNAGYGFGLAGQFIGTDVDGNKTTMRFGSLGQGIQFGAAVGYHFNEHVAAELSGGYLMGRKFEFEDKGPNGTDVERIYGRAILINPALVLCTDFEGSFAPYARFGLTVGLPTVTTETEGEVLNVKVEGKTRDHGGIALGFNSALGVQFQLADNIHFFAELQTLALSYAAKKWEIKEYTVDGKDELDKIEVTKGDYVKESDGDLKAEERLMGNKAAFSNVGLNVGVKISF